MRLNPLLLVGLAACSGGPGDSDLTVEVCEAGYREGDCPPDFTLPNHLGEPVSLSDYAGSVVIVESSAFW